MRLSCFHVPFLIFSVTNPKPILCGLTLEISWNSKVGIHDLVQVATGKVYAEFLTRVWAVWWMVDGAVDQFPWRPETREFSQFYMAFNRIEIY